jgi:hypothetical protein
MSRVLLLDVAYVAPGGARLPHPLLFTLNVLGLYVLVVVGVGVVLLLDRIFVVVVDRQETWMPDQKFRLRIIRHINRIRTCPLMSDAHLRPTPLKLFFDLPGIQIQIK